MMGPWGVDEPMSSALLLYSDRFPSSTAHVHWLRGVSWMFVAYVLLTLRKNSSNHTWRDHIARVCNRHEYV